MEQISTGRILSISGKYSAITGDVPRIHTSISRAFTDRFRDLSILHPINVIDTVDIWIELYKIMNSQHGVVGSVILKPRRN